MAYNNVSEIKTQLMLELENQTLQDDELESYLEDAQTELFSTIIRNRETDKYTLRDWHIDDEDYVEYVLYLKVDGDNGGILEVRDETNKEIISSDNYELTRGNQAIKINVGSDGADLETNTKIEVDYIPVNYKLCERAIAIVNLLSRLAPFQNEQINPNLMVWREKKKNFLNILKNKFGTGSYF